MTLSPLTVTPQQALKQAGRRSPVTRSDLERFKGLATSLVNNRNPRESEEYHKALVSDLLRKNGFDGSFFVNTKGRADLVIHNGPSADTTVGVIVEAKRPGNRQEMPSRTSLNCKAMQELLLYFLRERFASPAPNLQIRHLIITDSISWYVFDAVDFEAAFSQDAKLVRLFHEFESGRLSGTTTDFFYREIAAPAILGLSVPLRPTLFSIDGRVVQDEQQAALLLQLLSPAYLLKLPMAGHGTILNEAFYREILYILGLEESRVGNRRLISRVAVAKRQPGSLIENAIARMRASGSFNAASRAREYGDDQEGRLFGMALELAVTWMNRLLFLKLLEAQLLRIHGQDSDVLFLTTDRVSDFPQLSGLFFEVLAQPGAMRAGDLNRHFQHVPYLNSSLFEPTHLEREALPIAAMRADIKLPPYPRTALTDANGRRSREPLGSLKYIFRFLDAFDFSSSTLESTIRDDNRPLVSASVLGLIFEKINGYRDGSFYTPGNVTTHLACAAVRSAVIAKFNLAKDLNCTSLEDVHDAIDDIDEANRIVDSVRVCDPSAGSGHFLVSALNELLSIKSQLQILRDSSGRRLKRYELRVVDDELLVTDDDGEPHRYRPKLGESQRVQEALFHEKRNLIERCIFGVDVNPTSVNICRLRLWIELLKSSYYRSDGELETLPNIDINIKTGDALVSQFDLTTDLRETFKRKRVSRRGYMTAIRSYQNASSKSDKAEFHGLVETIKSTLTADLRALDPKTRKLNTVRNQLNFLRGQGLLFGQVGAQEVERQRTIDALEREAEQLGRDIEAAEESEALRNAFEWRLEFPEVLDDEGNFIGFDVVIGNPPYGVSLPLGQREMIISRLGRVPDYEIAYWFIVLAHRILRPGGQLGYIVQNSILFNVYSAPFRLRLLDEWRFEEVLDCSAFSLFPDAVVRNVMLLASRNSGATEVGFRRTEAMSTFADLIGQSLETMSSDKLRSMNQNWGLAFRNSDEVIRLVLKLAQSASLESEGFRASQGYIPYRRSDLQAVYGEAAGNDIIDNERWHSEVQIDSTYLQEVRGGGISRYSVRGEGRYIRYGSHVASFVGLKFLSGPRAIIREITNPRIIAGITEETLVGDPQTISLICAGSVISLPYIWALLNSRVATFYHSNSGAKVTKGLFPKILVEDVRRFPVPRAEKTKDSSRLANLAAWSLALSQAAPSTDMGLLEAEIDREVYAAFDLTDCEVELIESWCADRGLGRASDHPLPEN